MRRGEAFSGSLLFLSFGIAACSMVQPPPPPEVFELPTAPTLTSFFIPDPQNAKLYETLERQADQFLLSCAATHACDRAHFMRGLVALYADRETATDHFQAAVAMAPSSARAESSLFWLQLLEETPRGVSENGRFSLATIQLLRDLLDRELLAQQLLKELEASPVPALQRDLKVRDKKLEDLTKQLDALKKIDREMREKTLPARPSNKPTPSIKKENR
jgi:hypothetical protein